MGICFLAQGIRYKEGAFHGTTSSTIASLIMLAFCFLLVPTTLYLIPMLDERHIEINSMVISRTIAIMLLVFYALYLIFELRTHRYFFEEGSDPLDSEDGDPGSMASTAQLSLGPLAASAWIVVSLTLVVLCAEILIESHVDTTFAGNPTFVGFILFPFLGNINDCMCACLVAWKDKMDITILVTLGSSMQILLFTLPFLVILGWIIGEPLTLELGPFESAAVFVGVVTVNTMIQNGKSNYLVGCMCLSL